MSLMSVQILYGHMQQKTTSITSNSRYIAIRIYLIESIIHVYFVWQLLCVGIQTFTRNGQLMEERSTLKHESWSTSRGRESYTARRLLPNSHYTCHLLSVAGDKQSSTEQAPQAIFHTNPGSKIQKQALYNTK